MGLPCRTPKDTASSAINFAQGLTGNLLIVHGSGDDNVHFAGTEVLLNRLIELDKPSTSWTIPIARMPSTKGQAPRSTSTACCCAT